MATTNTTAPAPNTPKKSNTCLILIIILVVLFLLAGAAGVALLKVVPGLIVNKLTGTTQTNPNQNPLEKFIGGLVGGNNGGGNGLFDGGGGGLIPGGTGGGAGSKSEDEIALEQCVPGKTALGMGVGAGYAYTGKEKFSVDGQNVTLCCLAVYDITQGQTLANAETKMCGDSNETLVYLQKVDGQFVPFMAGYKKDGQDCSQIYDESGNIASNICE